MAYSAMPQEAPPGGPQPMDIRARQEVRERRPEAGGINGARRSPHAVTRRASRRAGAGAAAAGSTAFQRIAAML